MARGKEWESEEGVYIYRTGWGTGERLCAWLFGYLSGPRYFCGGVERIRSVCGPLSVQVRPADCLAGRAAPASRNGSLTSTVSLPCPQNLYS